MKREKDFFNCFVDKDDEYLPSFCHRPFYRDGYVVATDRVILIRAKYDDLKGVYVQEDKPKRLPDFPEPNCDFQLSLSKLVDTIKSIPEEEYVNVYGKDAECDECEGSGRVEWTYEDSDGEEHLEDFDCPICDGRGKVKTKKYLREWRCISVNGSIFSVRTLMKLAKAMDVAGFDTVNVKNLPTGCTPALMHLGGNFEVIIMPCPGATPVREIKLEGCK